jgi:hypothetical protein
LRIHLENKAISMAAGIRFFQVIGNRFIFKR